MKKISVKTLYLLAIIAIGLIGLGAGSTFAMFTASASIENPISLSSNLTYTSDALETKEIILAANEGKTIALSITNNTSDTLKYTAWYIPATGVQAGLSDLTVNTAGNIAAGNTISLNVVLKNNSSSTKKVTIGVSSNIGNVILSSNMTMIPYNVLSTTSTAMQTITNLFNKTGTVIEDPSGSAIALDVDTTHSLIKDQKGNIRYYGASPNNYIYFNCEQYPNTNCETWRIIGIVDGKVKLIRNEIIGEYSWDTSYGSSSGGGETISNDVVGNTKEKTIYKNLANIIENESKEETTKIVSPGGAITPPSVNSGNGVNEWSQADLMKLLNPGYDQNKDYVNGTTLSESFVNNSLYYYSSSETEYTINNRTFAQAGMCYNGSKDTATLCGFSTMGIKNDATRNKIAETTYYTGGWGSSSIYPNVILDQEGGTTVISSPADGITRTTTWTGRVAIPYPSDYGYAVDLSQCTGKNLYRYNDSTCTSNNWIKKIITNNGSSNGWLLTPYSGTANHAWTVGSSGSVSDGYLTCYAYGVAPVLYLTSDEIIESGSGTESDPYTLAA